MKTTDISQSALGEALHFLRMSGLFYIRSELSAPWGLDLPGGKGRANFHVVTSGKCWLKVAGAKPLELGAGDLVLIPHGEGHQIVDDLKSKTKNVQSLKHEHVSEHYSILRHGGDGPSTKLICGAVRFDHPAADHLIKLLPKVIHLKHSDNMETEWLHTTLRLMAGEARELRAGGETVIARLADILVIQAIRAWIQDDPVAKTGWLGALNDPQLGRALAKVHRFPTQDWNLETLASEAAMSRSAFAARFTEQVGESAIHYVTRWRMQVARGWLKEENIGVSEAANRFGYQSEAAFSRAFKRMVGVSPGSVRKGAE